jgi:hypothetical protein
LPVAFPETGGFRLVVLFERRVETDKTIASRGEFKLLDAGRSKTRAAMSNLATSMRKALLAMTLIEQSGNPPRRLRAALIGFGLDSGDEHNRLTRGQQSFIFGGSAETHAELRESAFRMERELSQRGQELGDLDPTELAELATAIELPELLEIALRLQLELEERGCSFDELSADELTAMSAPFSVKY